MGDRRRRGSTTRPGARPRCPAPSDRDRPRSCCVNSSQPDGEVGVLPPVDARGCPGPRPGRGSRRRRPAHWRSSSENRWGPLRNRSRASDIGIRPVRIMKSTDAAPTPTRVGPACGPGCWSPRPLSPWQSAQWAPKRPAPRSTSASSEAHWAPRPSPSPSPSWARASPGPNNRFRPTAAPSTDARTRSARAARREEPSAGRGASADTSVAFRWFAIAPAASEPGGSPRGATADGAYRPQLRPPSRGPRLRRRTAPARCEAARR
jgi:hypothetical protein